MKAVEKKINDDGIALQCRIFTEFPFPATYRKITWNYDNEKRPAREGYMPKWEKRINGRYIKILSDIEYGFPHGNDILIILFLIIELRRQNAGREIIFDTINSFLKTFDYTYSGENGKKALRAFKRIFYSTWYYRDEAGNEYSFRIMDYCKLFPEDGLFRGPEYKHKIVLTEEFCAAVSLFPVPYKTAPVIALKQSPMALNLYLFLVYRTWVNWKKEKVEAFIPFFGDNGLQNQLSSEIGTVRKFRQSIQGWVEQIKEHWPDCPVYFKEESHLERPKGRRPRKYLDGLFLHCTSPDQLHVPPHWDKELRLAIEEGQQVALKAAQTPTEKQAKVIRSGGSTDDVARLDAGTMTKAEATKIVGEILAKRSEAWDKKKG